MFIPRDFPSQRLRHWIRVWRYRRRREAWSRWDARAEPQTVRPALRHRLAAVLLLGAVLCLTAIISVRLALRATSSLERARSALNQARDDLATGSTEQMVSNFETARSEFEAAKATMDNPVVSVVASLPLIGRTADGIRTAAQTGLLVTDAAQGLSSAVGRLRGGLESLSLSGERIPVRALEKFQPAVEVALSKMSNAELLADDVATTFVPRALAQAGDQLRSTLHEGVSALRSTNAMLTALPEFAGMEHLRRYFLVPQDPAQLRGTGGSFSYWAILKIDRGRLSLQPFHYIEELPSPEHTEWPSHTLEAAYGSMNAAGDWDFANAPADGPTAARFITQLWEQTGKKPIDGVIMTDPHALSSMLEATGPVQVSGVPVSLTSDNVVSFLTRDAYLLPGSAHVRRGYLGLAPLGIFQEFLAKAKGYAAVRALVDAASAGHILLNATDPDTESDLRIAGITGAIAPAPDEDLFALAINNLAANRVDYYVERTIEYDVTLMSDGSGRATASVTLDNHSPSDPSTPALASLLLPHAGPADLEPGEAYERITITGGRGSRLLESSVDGADSPMTAHAVGGLRTFTRVLRISPQGSITTTMTFDLGYVWRGDGAQGTYELFMPTQPVIQSVSGTVTIHAPRGMTIASTNPGMQVDGSSATWSGSMSEPLTFRTRFERDTLGRVWWGLKSAF
jgi:hypothetical protein